VRIVFSPLGELTFVQRILVRLIMILYSPFLKIENGERLCFSNRPAIFVFNHSNSFETVLLAAYLTFRLGDSVRFVVDWVWGYLPITGWLIRQVDPIFVYNKRAKIALMEPIRRRAVRRPVWQQINDTLAAGKSVGLFPEGTRNGDPNNLMCGRTG